MTSEDFLLKKKGDDEEVVFKCGKCGKEKKKSQGIFVLEGSTFCCRVCCGDPAKGEPKQKNDNVCEFC